MTATMRIIHHVSDVPLPYPPDEIRRQRAKALAELALIGRQVSDSAANPGGHPGVLAGDLGSCRLGRGDVPGVLGVTVVRPPGCHHGRA